MRASAVNPPQTTKTFIMMGIAKHHFVPEHHLQVVLKDGQFHKLLPAGYHFISPFSCTLGNLISIGIRACAVELSGVRSSDGIPFEVNAYMRYQFDPRECANVEIQSKLSKVSEIGISNLVMKRMEEGIRDTFGQHPSHHLHLGQMRPILQRESSLPIKNNLRPLGIKPIGQTIFDTITPPPRIEAVHQKISGRSATFAQMQGMSSEDVSRLLWAELLAEFEQAGGSLNLIASQIGTSIPAMYAPLDLKSHNGPYQPNTSPPPHLHAD